MQCLFFFFFLSLLFCYLSFCRFTILYCTVQFACTIIQNDQSFLTELTFAITTCMTIVNACCIRGKKWNFVSYFLLLCDSYVPMHFYGVWSLLLIHSFNVQSSSIKWSQIVLNIGIEFLSNSKDFAQKKKKVLNKIDKTIVTKGYRYRYGISW